jgi:thiamine-monophosphate kinase
MKVAELGEFGLIWHLARALARETAATPATTPEHLLVGIGDDAAVWKPTVNTLAIATVDTLVEGVHFDLRTTTWRDLGWKAVAVNISDIAAMGGLPRYVVVALSTTKDRAVEEIQDLYHGMAEAAKAYGAAIVGGDTTGGPITTISVTVFGESLPDAREQPLLRRSTAKPGDAVAVTGWLGASAGGLRLLQRGQPPRDDAARSLVEAHRRPIPRVREAQVLLRAGLRCGMDVSDGLLGDATRICEASGVGMRLFVDRVPVHPALRATFPEEALALALTGGEDYELLVAGPREAIDRAAARLRQEADLPLTVVGEVVEPFGVGPLVRLVDAQGHEVAPPGRAWEHFA